MPQSRFSYEELAAHFDESMKGTEGEDVTDFAEHLKAKAPLGISGKEALRMADAQKPPFRMDTTRKAIEIAVRELLMKAA